MPLTEYQKLIKKHLEYLLEQDRYKTSEVVVAEEEREFVVNICNHFDYVPVFSWSKGSGFVTFVAIKYLVC